MAFNEANMSACNCPDVLVENYGTTSSGLLWFASNARWLLLWHWRRLVHVRRLLQI